MNLILVVKKYVQMHQNTFLTLQTLKNIFFKNLILVVWEYVQLRQNMYITTSDVK